jgi:hypothetical protein
MGSGEFGCSVISDISDIANKVALESGEIMLSLLHLTFYYRFI